MFQERKLYDNSVRCPVTFDGVPTPCTVREDFHLERDGSSINIVSDGLTDYQKEIESQKSKAGLENILKFQEMRYGSIQNAIVRNEEKKFYADVSKIPDTVEGKKKMVEDANKELDLLAAKLGVSRSELLSMSNESIASSLSKNEEGGQE